MSWHCQPIRTFPHSYSKIRYVLSWVDLPHYLSLPLVTISPILSYWLGQHYEWTNLLAGWYECYASWREDRGSDCRRNLRKLDPDPGTGVQYWWTSNWWYGTQIAHSLGLFWLNFRQLRSMFFLIYEEAFTKDYAGMWILRSGPRSVAKPVYSALEKSSTPIQGLCLYAILF